MKIIFCFYLSVQFFIEIDVGFIGVEIFNPYDIVSMALNSEGQNISIRICPSQTIDKRSWNKSDKTIGDISCQFGMENSKMVAAKVF